MDSSTPSVYKPWLHHPNGSSSSLVANGLEIGIPPSQTLPGTSQKNVYLNRPLPSISAERFRDNLETFRQEEAPVHHTSIETKSPFPLYNYPLERLKDAPTPPPPRSSNNTSPKSTQSTGSARKIRQLTGLDLNIESGLSAESGDSSPYESENSPTFSSTDSMHSQAGADYDHWDVGPSSGYYSAQRIPGPRTETAREVNLQPSIYHAPKQLHMNRQTSTPLRHAERSNKQKGKLRIEEHVRSQSPGDRNALRDIIYQEQQRQDSLDSLIPKLLAIRPKKPKPVPSPSKFGLIQSARESLAYGINELTGSSLKTSLSVGDTPPSSRNASSMNTRQSTPVSPMGAMESDNIILPPLPPIPLTPELKGRKSGKQHFENAFYTAQEELETVNGPSELGRRLSGRLRHLAAGRSSPLPNASDIMNGPSEVGRNLSGRLGNLTGGRSSPLTTTKQAVAHNRAIKLDDPRTSIPNKSGFIGLLPPAKLLQKGNEHFLEVVEKAKKSVHLKSAEEKRRKDLKQKIMVVGTTDQTPDGRVSEWL